MQNPKTWAGPTPVSHSGKVDKSGGGKTSWDAPRKNGERPSVVAPTPFNHFKKVPISGDGHPNLGNASTTMGAPRAMSSDRSFGAPNTTMTTTPKSMPAPPVDAVKWHKKKKYNLVVPASYAESAPIVAKMKAK